MSMSTKSETMEPDPYDAMRKPEPHKPKKTREQRLLDAVRRNQMPRRATPYGSNYSSPFTACLFEGLEITPSEHVQRLAFLNKLRVRLVETPDSVSLEDEIHYCSELRLFGLMAGDSDQPKVLCRPPGLWFPMPDGTRTNAVWIECIFRVYHCALRLLRYSVEHDTAAIVNPSSFFQCIDLDERKKHLKLSKYIIWLANRLEQDVIDRQTSLEAHLTTRLGLSDTIRSIYRSSLRGYACWNAGCIVLSMDSTNTSDEKEQRGQDDILKGMSDMDLDQPTSNGSNQCENYDPIVSLLAIRTKPSQLSNAADMFFTCYLCMSGLPKFVLLTGGAMDSALALPREQVVQNHTKLMKARGWGDATRACRSVYWSGSEGQRAMEYVYSKPSIGTVVMYNQSAETVNTRTSRPVWNDPLPPTLEWSRLAQSCFLILCAAKAKQKGQTDEQVAFTRAAVQNHFPLPEARDIEMLIGSHEYMGMANIPTSVRGLIPRYVSNCPSVLCTGEPPQTVEELRL